MVTRFRKGRCVFAVIAAAITCLGFATPALADSEQAYDPNDTLLTKVIVASADADASNDSYVFHFAGGGEVTARGSAIYSDGVEQDTTTIKEKDIVPTISDVTLTGKEFTNANTLSNGQQSQAVVQKSLSDILAGVKFPHAGVYTYVVTEKSAITALADGTFINASKAEYKLRIRVANSKKGNASELGNRDTTIESVTVERTKDDNGNPLDMWDDYGNPLNSKVDPAYPKTDVNGKISETAYGVQPAANELAGDARGRNVPGFTFANEYMKGGSFQVKKLYDGDHSDRSRYSFVELYVYSAAAAQGSCLTYQIEGGGIDRTTNNLNGGEHLKLSGVYDTDQANDYMVKFDDSGWACIQADLKEDSVIRITGEFGPEDAEYAGHAANGKDRRETLSRSGLLEGQTYYVIERSPYDYRPTGYVYFGVDSADPRVNKEGMRETANYSDPGVTDPTHVEEDGFGQNALCVEGEATGAATTVFVVNTLDENKVSVTGILIDNLPYVLMIGIPVIVFIALFVLRRRRVAAE